MSSENFLQGGTVLTGLRSTDLDFTLLRPRIIKAVLKCAYKLLPTHLNIS